MQPVTINLEGSYWDSQIYSGELILFGYSGEYHKINWSDFINEVADGHKVIQTAIRVAFSDSDLFYTPKVRRILTDPLIAAPIVDQLKTLSKSVLTEALTSESKYWNISESPFDFLPVDTDIYYNNLIAGSEMGLFSSSRSLDSKKNGDARKHFDGNVLRVRASHQSTAVAVAAGSDGLFQLPYLSESQRVFGDVEVVAKRSCNSCDWAFQSIMAWDSESAYLAHFEKTVSGRNRKEDRAFDSVIDEEMFFNGQDAIDSYIWGSHEKIFKIHKNQLSVANYDNRSQRREKNSFVKITAEERFSCLGARDDLEFTSDEIVASGTAPFGSILELDDRLVVLRSDGEINIFEGEPIQWRVFPRSDRYSNQLHIIYEDRIQVTSFVHDYFVNQQTKLTGFSRSKDNYSMNL